MHLKMFRWTKRVIKRKDIPIKKFEELQTTYTRAQRWPIFLCVLNRKICARLQDLQKMYYQVSAQETKVPKM